MEGTPDAAGPAALERELASLGATNELLTSALVEANDQLLGLYALARLASDAGETNTLVEDLAAEVCTLAGARAVVIVGPDGSVVTHGDPEASSTIRQHVVDGGCSGLQASAATGEPFDMILRPAGDDLHAIALAGPPGRALRTPQVKLAEAMFAQIDGFIGLARLHQEALAHALVERDAAAAATIAGHALPLQLPALVGVEVAARCDPARLGGGDFYTWVETDNGLAFALGDVAGKGLPAAMVMTLVCESFRATVRRAPQNDPAALLTAVNASHAEYLTRTGLFVTLVAGFWRRDTHEVCIANAGHSPVCHWDGSTLATINPSAPPVGVLDDITPENVRFDLGPGHKVILGTDGLVEQEDETGQQIGYGGFGDLVSATALDDAQTTIDHLFAAVEKHGGTQQDDDRTALVLRRLPTYETLLGEGNAPCMN